jgi:tetratricopeptide (TPR) repeat protein
MRALSGAEAALAAAIFTRLSAGQGAALIEDARALVARAPDAPDAQHALALCLAQGGRADEADEVFARALALAPGHAVIQANRARCLRRAGRVRSAAACWQQRIQDAPADAQAWMELGLHQLDLSSPDPLGLDPMRPEPAQRTAAIESLRRALALDARLVRAWHGLGAALRDQDALPEAEDALRSALALDPSKPVLWASLAGVLRLAGRPEEAVDAYRQAEQLGRVEPDVLDAQVGALIDCLRLEEAHALGRRIIREHPEFVPAHSTLAHLNWEYGLPAGENEPPEAFFRRSADAQPGNLDLQLGLIGFLLESKQGEEAFDRLQRLRAQADDPRLVALQANALEISGQAARAAPLYAEADRSLGERDVSFNNAYVRHLLKAGEWKSAAVRAERALSIEPQNQETWAYLGTAWRLTGDPREDWLCGYERLVELMPVDVPRGWSEMSDFLSDLREALEPLHRARTEPVTQSLRGGSQTPGRLFGRQEPRIAGLRQALVTTIERWLAALPVDPQHPYLARTARSVRFTGSWSVKLWQSGSHANHFHSDGWMSSAFYVALPPSVQAVRSGQAAASSAGCLQLGQPPVELGLDLSPRRIIQPIAGHLALFPSYLWHGTVPFEDVEPRITVAFDMQPQN